MMNRFLLALLLLAAGSSHSSAFEVLDPVWPEPTTTFHVDIPYPQGDQIWNNAVKDAMTT